MARFTTGFFSGLRRIRLVLLCFEQSVEDDNFSYPVGLESAVGHETKVLFTVLVLYRRAFAADLHTEFEPSFTLLNPPPSSTPKSVKYAQMLPELRKALGKRVFEDNNTDVEDEGEVVDMEDYCHEPLSLLNHTVLLQCSHTSFKLPTTTMSNREIYDLRAKYTRFRILVIGRANAGKTTVLQRVCNTTEEACIYDENNKNLVSVHRPEDEFWFWKFPLAWAYLSGTPFTIDIC